MTCFNTLDTNLQQILIGAAGNLAAEIVQGLFGAASYSLRKRFQKPPLEETLRAVVTQALLKTTQQLTDDPDEAQHFLSILGDWLRREAVIGEFSQVLEPRPDVALDLPTLEAEFEAAGFAAEWLGAGRDFASLVASFVRAFYDAAASQPLLQGQLEIGLLRGIAERSEQIAQRMAQQLQESRRQSELQQRMLEQSSVVQPPIAQASVVTGDSIRVGDVTQSQNVIVGKGMNVHIGDVHHPPPQPTADLDEIELPYLNDLYKKCNELPLVDDNPVDARQARQPRLQQVYVELHLDAQPSPAQILRRLGMTEASQRQRAEQIFNKALKSMDDGSKRKGKAKGKADAADPRQPLDWAQHIQHLSKDDLKELAKQLSVEPDALTAALGLLTPLDALIDQPQLVLLGDPGSGKSTLTRHLAGLLAAKRLEIGRLGDWEIQSPNLPISNPPLSSLSLPIHIVLSRWAAHLPERTEKTEGSATDLIDECLRLLGQTANLSAQQRELFAKRFSAAAPSILLLLDGLDEVVDGQKRARLLQAVRAFHNSYGHVPMIVTCRLRPYETLQQTGEALPLPGYALAPLSSATIADFLQRWHAELVWADIYQPDEADKAQRRLQGALQDTQRKELHEMAQTPLLLTMMARVNYRHGLPDSRAELYEDYVKQLLWEWERQKQGERGQPTSLEILLRQASVDKSVDKKALETTLNQLAYGVHGQAGSRDTVNISESTLRTAFESLYPDAKQPGGKAKAAAWAVEVLALIADRSGLINDLGEATYQFSHRTFQEYLAARHLASGLFLGKFKERIDQEAWREALLLAIGYQVSRGDYDNVLTVVANLLPEQIGNKRSSKQSSTVNASRLLILAEGYVRILGSQLAQKAEDKMRLADLEKRLPKLLLSAMQNAKLAARQRLDAGLLLDALGIEPPGLDDFVPIPGTNLRIGRYPVTNGQFRRFFAAGGYQNPAWWSEVGWQNKEKYEWTEPRFWDDDRFNQRTQPVVGISWYEAEAYCNWLSAAGRQGLRTGETARLPSQEEWMQAARNGQTVADNEAEDYPWRGVFEAWFANTEESSLEQTTPVHLYPDGVTPAGVWDMAGNVWEWTADAYDKDRDWFYMKGGSAWNDAGQAKAASRVRYHLWYFRHYGGFRVLSVPSSR